MELKKGLAFFDEADFLNVDEAFVALMNQGSLKFNQTAAKWMGIKDKRCMMIAHDSPGRPELATKIYFYPNNEEPKKGVNFKFTSFANQGIDATISCKRVIYQNPNLTSLIESRDTEKKRLKITFDEKVKLHCHELTPQFCSQLSYEHFYKATSISCIYSLYKGREMVYYGETGDLKQTCKRHQEDGKKFDCIHYTELKDNEALRKYWERFFLLKWKEEHNGQLPQYNKLVPNEVDLNQTDIINLNNRKVAVNETYVG